MPLDLLEGAGIDRLGGALAERYGRLDVLIGNAAELGTLSPLGHVEPKVFERVMALNAGANYRLIRSFDPSAARAPAGRAIFVTCSQARGQALLGRLCRQQGRARGARAELRGRGPPHGAPGQSGRSGPLRTRLRAKAYPGEDPLRLPEPDTVAEAFVALAETGCTHHGRLIEAADHLPGND